MCHENKKSNSLQEQKTRNLLVVGTYTHIGLTLISCKQQYETSISNVWSISPFKIFLVYITGRKLEIRMTVFPGSITYVGVRDTKEQIQSINGIAL